MATEPITNAGPLAPHYRTKHTAPTTTSNHSSNGDGRVILHLDYDCFYASVFENAEPGLRSRPLGVQQKSILATCNYAARARGVRKLMPVSEALRACPDLALRNGEDLAPFRAASRRLWSALRSYLGSSDAESATASAGPAWNLPVERLGLDEVFVDATAAVDYNAALLNRNDLGHSFFQLDPGDPEKGFAFDATAFCGHVYPPLADGGEGDANMPPQQRPDVDDPAQVRLMLASHLAGHLRGRLESEHGHTSSGGVATNKVLAKLAGSAHKPRDQTTLLPGPGAAVQDFLDPLPIRKIPGVGARTAALIESSMLARNGTKKHPDAQQQQQQEQGAQNEAGALTVRDVRRHASTCSAAALSRILEHGGQQQQQPRGAGARVWALLHGVDATPVRATGAVPTQLGVEDTYAARPLRGGGEVARELRALASSLVARMRAELLVDDEPPLDKNDDSSGGGGGGAGGGQRWIARPRTLRLSTRAHPGSSANANATTNRGAAFARGSRSQPLPSFVFDLSAAAAEIAERLVQGSLLPLFRRLHPHPGGYNLALLNVSVTNMVVVAGGEGVGGGIDGGGGAGGRDISRMFRTQEQKLREWTVYDTGGSGGSGDDEPVGANSGTAEHRGTDAGLGPAHHHHHHQQTATPEEQTSHFNITPPLPREEAETWDDGTDEEVWEDGDEEMPDGSGGGGGGGGAQKCPLCGCALPDFAMAAHERFHAMGG